MREKQCPRCKAIVKTLKSPGEGVHPVCSRCLHYYWKRIAFAERFDRRYEQDAGRDYGRPHMSELCPERLQVARQEIRVSFALIGTKQTAPGGYLVNHDGTPNDEAWLGLLKRKEAV